MAVVQSVCVTNHADGFLCIARGLQTAYCYSCRGNIPDLGILCQMAGCDSLNWGIWWHGIAKDGVLFVGALVRGIAGLPDSEQANGSLVRLR